MAKSLAEQLRDHVKRDGRSLYALSKASGIDRGILVRFVNGTRTITIETAGPLAKVLGVELQPKRKKRR